MDFVDILP